MFRDLRRVVIHNKKYSDMFFYEKIISLKENENKLLLLLLNIFSTEGCLLLHLSFLALVFSTLGLYLASIGCPRYFIVGILSYIVVLLFFQIVGRFIKKIELSELKKIKD